MPKASHPEDSTRRTAARSANEQLRQGITDSGSSDDARFPFHCECGDRSCMTVVDVTLEEYEAVRRSAARFVIARNHENPEDERVILEHARFAVVDTVTSELAKVGMEGNPRWQRGEPW